MLKVINITLLLVFSLFSSASGEIYNKKKFDFVASFDNIAITKFDLDNLIQIEQYDKKFKDKSEKKYNETLGNYIDLLVMDKIIKKHSIALTKKEEENLWKNFSDNFKTKLTLKEFCKSNEIDEIFFTKYMTINYLWTKFINANVINKIKIDDNLVNQFIEFNTKDKPTNYSLSEIVIFYSNNEEHNRSIDILSGFYEKIKAKPKKFEKYVQKYSQSSTKDEGGFLGIFSDKDLSKDIVDKIKDVKIGDISEIICIKKDFEGGGSCLIFKINDIKSTVIVSEEEKQQAKMYIRNKKIEEEITTLIEKTKSESLIKIRDNI